MTPRTRLLIGGAAALLAWMLGYTMGGGLRVGGKVAAESGEGSAAHRGGHFKTKAATEGGTTRLAEDNLADQVASRRIPWTRERLLNSVKAIGQEPDIITAIRFGMKLTEQLGLDDFPLAIEVAEEMKDSLDEEGLIYKAMAIMRWAELKPEAVAEYLRANDKIRKEFLFSDGDMVFAVWGGSNPTAAIAWAKTLRKEQQTEALKKILEASARRDPDAALALAQAHAPDLLKDGGVAGAIQAALRKRDPERSARTVASLGDEKNISSAAQNWARNDRAAATRWAQELPDEKLRTAALKGVWQEFANKAPNEAAAQLSKNAPDAVFIEDSGKNVIRILAQKDPQQAEQWAATLRQPEARKEAFVGLGEHYAAKDLAEASHWLSSLPEGTDRQNAVLGFVYRAKASDPVQATGWATAVQDDAARRAALQTTLSEWFRRDLPGALEWLQNSTSISEEDRQAILEKK